MSWYVFHFSIIFFAMNLLLIFTGNKIVSHRLEHWLKKKEPQKIIFMLFYVI